MAGRSALIHYASFNAIRAAVAEHTLLRSGVGGRTRGCLADRRPALTSWLRALVTCERCREAMERQTAAHRAARLIREQFEADRRHGLKLDAHWSDATSVERRRASELGRAGAKARWDQGDA